MFKRQTELITKQPHRSLSGEMARSAYNILNIQKGSAFMRFAKLHGLGNDYVCINCLEEMVNNPEKLAKDVCRRRFSVGADGLLLIKPSCRADFFMEMYNPDGSRGAMCGNGIRCFAKYIYDNALAGHLDDMLIETDSGIKQVRLHIENDRVQEVTVDMGEPVIYINKTSPADEDVANGRQEHRIGHEAFGTTDCIASSQRGCLLKSMSDMGVTGNIYMTLCTEDLNVDVINVSVGNPHAVVFCDDVKKADVMRLGRMIENHEYYPERTNVEFVRVVKRDLIEMRVWERGAGETLACGTGACAACAAAIAAGKVNNNIGVVLPGGELNISYEPEGGHLFLRGPACEVYRGEYYE